MISKWKLANFKAIAKETELDFAPLTILAGANSSGKSTLLQSVLLISQTLAHRKSHAAVLLNGNLVRLGHYQDLRTKHSSTEDIRIGWTISRPSNDRVAKSSPNDERKRPHSGNRNISSDVLINVPTNQSYNSASKVRPSVVYSKLEIADDPPNSEPDHFTWITAAREPHQINHHQNRNHSGLGALQFGSVAELGE